MSLAPGKCESRIVCLLRVFKGHNHNDCIAGLLAHLYAAGFSK